MKQLLSILCLLISINSFTQTIREEAENYSSMSGIQTETTIDSGGGLNVGFIQASDWIEYSINAPISGTYNFNLRIASVSASIIEVKTGGIFQQNITLPITVGYQTWKTVTTSITLSQGINTIRLTAITDGWNINWFELIAPDINKLIDDKINAFANTLDNVLLRKGNSIIIDTLSIPNNSKVKFNLQILANGGGEKNVTISRTAAGKYTIEKDVNIETYTNWSILLVAGLPMVKLNSAVVYIYSKEAVLTL